MDKAYEVKSVIICDDIRQERSGKEIIIGVYSNAIIFGAFPAKMHKLVFRVMVVPQRANLKRVRVKVVDHNDKQLFSMDQPFTTPPNLDPEDAMMLGFEAGDIVFPEPTKYRVLFALDGEPEEVARFSVRGPKSDVEAGRLS